MLEKLKKLIPKKIRSRFTNRPMLQKIVKNIGWLSFERFLELLVALLVGVWIARYLGPNDYGLMNFAIAFTALFTPLIGLGLDAVLSRELINSPNKKELLLGTIFKLKLFSSIFIGCLMVLIIFLIKPTDFILILMILIFALGNIVNSFSCIGIYFQSKIESHKLVKSSSFALIISNLIRIFFIILNFSVIWFVIASLINTIINIFGYFYFYFFKERNSFFKWNFDKILAKKLLLLSWPLILSGAFAIIYLKIDQVMIGLLLNEYEVGIYSVAVKISEIGYFLPGAIASSLFPIILASRKKDNKVYFHRLQRMFDFFTWLPLLIVIPIFFLSNFIINFLYGVEYVSAGIVLSILIWALLAIFIRSATDNYINSEQLYKITLYVSLMGATINIVANLILIPIFGIIGAALATIISYFFVAYIANLFFEETRFLFRMQLKSFNLVRIINEYKK